MLNRESIAASIDAYLGKPVQLTHGRHDPDFVICVDCDCECVLQVQELDAAVPDGYAALDAPYMPGALLQPHCIARSEPAPERAVVRALHACAASLLWWRQGHPDAAPPALAEICRHLKALQVRACAR